ncbi:hypothetical protein GLOTRDRAFT_80224 [Gloeophyllum trabeum ATCC 11539]|uniref:Protein UNC80 C-terminal domain-containing protein n=1 Tax=Gloeophyllum trabeum (strain ATCC 11539 / FP-39264 / Madison 617) TaxID=670483 RepID=S7RHK7_GLOTA|nr:uncharacterized protein GLOTRDRAFT_80224 [Gloeophyllum trabeum ATCC 11539]EPQ52074.1 hypothetical protein GLOTRDRAFT_80224 [Gloeophyllum trabeum ATCC 11539]
MTWEDPVTVQTLLHNLFSLLSLYGLESATAAESKILRQVLSKIQEGSCCRISVQALEEEYGAISVKGEDESIVREAMFSNALIRCFENGAEASRRWLLWNTTEDYWPSPLVSSHTTPLLSKLQARNIDLFVHAAIVFLSPSSTLAAPDTLRIDAGIIVRLVQSRILPQVDIMQDQDAQSARATVSKLILRLLLIESSRSQAKDYMCEWTLDAFMRVLPEETRKPLMAFCLPCTYDALAAEATPLTDEQLTQVLNDISRAYPQLFFKPVILCAASSKDTTVIKQLRICTALTGFVADFFTRDSEMMSVALLSDPGGKSAVAAPKPTSRLGQLVILLELISSIRHASHNRDQISSIDPSYSTLPKFIFGLDAQLGVLLEAKVNILYAKYYSAAWLPRVMSWALEMYGEDELKSDSERSQAEFDDTVKRVQDLYHGLNNDSTMNHKRRSALVLSPSFDWTNTPGEESGIRSGPNKSIENLEVILSNSAESSTLRLLVAVSGLLRTDDFSRLSAVIWKRCLDNSDSKVIAPACFLAMQCAEKLEDNFLSLVRDDLHSTDASKKASAVRKLSNLASWRFQLLTQDHILDTNHRRAFKLTRPPLLFVATDMGTSLFVHNEDSTEYIDSQGNVLPAELRKRLAEIGWSQDEKPVDEKMLLKKTPISVLPNSYMDQSVSTSESLISAPSSPNVTPEASPKKLSPSRSDERLGKRPNSARNVKRRPVFVHALVSVFPDVALLTFDPDITVSSMARTFIADLMRDDPALLCRPVFDSLAGDERDLARAVRTLRTFAHVRKDLPPSLTHHVFNHLAGFLKYCSRLEEDSRPLLAFAQVLPIMSKLASQVSEISIREIRRAKVEIFLIPSGALWFPSTSPDGPMFPRQLSKTSNPFHSLPPDLVWMTMIRISQNLLFLDMLKQNPQDVQIVRKRLARLVLPSRDGSVDSPKLELMDLVPRKPDGYRSSPISFTDLNAALIGLSLILSRSYLLLVRQIFSSMSRHLNDRNELSVYLDGLNRILLAHGNDVGIVSQAMIALLTATTRFQRLFQSGSGYTLFMPVVVKVYTESENHSGIRGSIEYAVNRFYALHGYAFIFQSMSILAHIIACPGIDAQWVAKGIYSLFATLKSGVLPTDPESIGLHKVSRKQEREALIVNTAEEKPQTFLASLRRAAGPTGEAITIDLPEEYEGKRFELRDFALFFINFIAEQDATLLRAELFLHFLCLLTPSLYHGSNSARTALRDGTEHIGAILLTRAPGKAKIPDATLLNPSLPGSVEVYSHDSHFENHLMSKSTSPSNLQAMRLEYLSLVVALTKVGGKLSSAAHLRVAELLGAIVKDSGRDVNGQVAIFLKDYANSVLLRPTPQAVSAKEITSFLIGLLPFVRDNARAIDCSGLLDVLCELVRDKELVQDALFPRVVREYCTAVLRLCEGAAEENSILELSLRSRVVLLLTRSVSLAKFDAVAEVVQCRATPGFLAGIVLPLTLSIGTDVKVTPTGTPDDAWQHRSQTTAWIRLLSYILSICDGTHKISELRRSSSMNGPERSKSQDGRRHSDPSRPAILALALQTLKVIISRVENELSASIPGIWLRIATTVRTLLSEGDARFAVTPTDENLTPSPSQSPLSSSFLSSPSVDPFGSSSGLYRQGSGSSRILRPPRLVDYLLWSFLWWLHLQRGPLLLQLRLFVHEKMYALDQSLRSEEDTSHSGWSSTSDHRRSSVFIKPRGRVFSSIHSATSSPEASPRLGPTSLPSGDSLTMPTRERKPGYRLSSSPSAESRGSSSLKIVHLGPVRRSIAINLERSFAHESGGPDPNPSRLLSNAGVMKLPSLVKETYLRVRMVQQYMGYGLLVPFPTGREGEEYDSIPVNHRSQILRRLVEESKELLEDLCSQEREGDDDIVMVNIDDASS